MPSNIDLQIGQVVQTSDPTQFDKFKDERNIDYQPGTIRVRIRNTPKGTGQEITAIPANPNYLTVPLYGEQVIVFNTISGQATDLKSGQYYYMSIVNMHGQVNNNIMPFLQDTRVGTKNYLSQGIQSTQKK